MHFDGVWFEREVLRLSREYGIGLSREQARLCHLHVELMLEWNGRMNLTRITDPEEIITKHILDSLIPTQWLPVEGWAADIGSGAGFPGIPIKILFPQVRMVLLEANRKKISFLKVLAAHLGLKEVWPVHGRWEQADRIGAPVAAGRFDLVLMRAIRLEPTHLTEMAPGLLRPGGRFAWWGGADTENVRGFSGDPEHGMVLERSEFYGLPGMERPRRLLVWGRTSDEPGTDAGE